MLEAFKVLTQITAALTIGVIAGLFPLNLAKGKGRNKLATISFLSCIILGLLGGLVLAIPGALIFSAVIYLSEPRQDTEQTDYSHILIRLSFYIIVFLWVKIFFFVWGNRWVHNGFQSIADFIFP